MSKLEQLKQHFENENFIVFEVFTNGRYAIYEGVTKVEGSKVTAWRKGQRKDLDKLVTLDFSKYTEDRIELMM